MALGKQIRRAREDRGITMTDLAKIVGVSTAAVSIWEADKSIPRAAMLNRVAKALGITVQFLQSTQAVPPLGKLQVDQILDHAKCELATVLGIPKDRIDLSFTVKA